MLSNTSPAPHSIDTGVAERQAFGASFERPTRLDEALSRYWNGLLRLPPHPDWNGDFTDWQSDPFSDRNWQFQHHTLRWINALRWSALKGDAAARAEWLRVAKSWFESNVPASKSTAPFAWKDMADGNRAIQLSLGAPLVSDNDAPWYISLLEAHRDWLMDEANLVGGNHGLHQHAGLLVVGAALRDNDATSTSRERLEDQFVEAFDAQGCNNEGSVAYQQLNILWWAQTWNRVKAEGMSSPDIIQVRLAAARTALAHLTQPNGGLPQLGDSARTNVRPGISPETDFLATQGKKGHPPRNSVLVLEGGYVASRSGWGGERELSNESHMVLRHGKFRRAHGHYDTGSIHLYSGGHRWLTDPGFHSYQLNDPTRDYLKSREAHNVAYIAGVARDEKVPVDLIKSDLSDQVDDFVLQDCGYGSHRLLRRVIYLRDPDCWIVYDSVDAAEFVALAQNWQVEPGLTVRYSDHGFRLTDKGRSLTMTWLGAGATLERKTAVDGEHTGWVGTKWKSLEAGTRLVASSGRRNRLVTLIAPHHPTPLGIVDSHVTVAGNLSLNLTRGSSHWRIRAIRGDISIDTITY